MPTSRHPLLLSLLLLAFLAAPPALGQTGFRAWAIIELPDGAHIEGPLLGMSADGYVVEVAGVALTIRRDATAAVEIVQREDPHAGPTAGAQTPDEPAQIPWMVIRRTDGSVVAGTLIRQTERDVVLLSGGREVATARADIASTATGILGTAEAEAEAPTVQARVDAAVPAVPSAATWDEYHQRRLVMLDSKARVIGSPSVGFDWDQFNRRGTARYHFVFGKRMRTRLRTIEFEELVSDPTFSAALELAMQRALNDRKAGWAFLLGGVGALGTAVALNSIGAADSDLSPVLFGGIPLLSSGIVFIVVGAALDVQSRKRQDRIRGMDFAALVPRDRAWTAMQGYNGALRRELGLPDDEALDGPPEEGEDPLDD